MARHGQVYTRDLSIEARQHELLGLDLGEGPPRRTLGFGILVTGLWWALLGVILGPPTQVTSTLWLLPPILLTWYGMRDGASQPRRRRVTEWVLALRYPLTGHRPIIRLGARRATRAEQLPVSERWAFVRSITGAISPASVRPVWADDQPISGAGPFEGRQVGRPITVRQRAKVESAAHLYRDLTAKKRAAR